MRAPTSQTTVLAAFPGVSTACLFALKSGFSQVLAPCCASMCGGCNGTRDEKRQDPCCPLNAAKPWERSQAQNTVKDFCKSVAEPSLRSSGRVLTLAGVYYVVAGDLVETRR